MAAEQTRTAVIERLGIEPAGPAQPARYRLRFADAADIELNDHVGRGLRIEWLGTVRCRHCQTPGRRSYGGGYCYDCFSTLARCDLCVVSPDRCHYHLGTCREPRWGEDFCMQPHVVYLANTSGIKVGITRQGRTTGRWFDQGAIQALVILEADTRRDAGLAEVAIAERLPDRTEWRQMLHSRVPPLDLVGERSKLEAGNLPLTGGVRWVRGHEVVQLDYPLADCPRPQRTLKLEAGKVQGNLLGMKGQYLVLSSGALNVSQHAGYEIRLSLLADPLADPGDGGTQTELF